MSSNWARVLVGLLAGTAFTTVALVGASAEEATALDGEKLYKERTCIACHGPDARTPILPEYPKIAGQSELYIVRQIKDIKSRARNNGNTAAMAGVLHLVNDQEIEALAKYLAELATCP
jgi:cytochrome c